MTYEELQASPFKSKRNSATSSADKDVLFDFPAGFVFINENYSDVKAVNLEPVLWHYNNVNRIVECTNGAIHVYVSVWYTTIFERPPYVDYADYPPSDLFNIYDFDAELGYMKKAQKKLW